MGKFGIIPMFPILIFHATLGQPCGSCMCCHHWYAGPPAPRPLTPPPHPGPPEPWMPQDQLPMTLDHPQSRTQTPWPWLPWHDLITWWVVHCDGDHVTWRQGVLGLVWIDPPPKKKVYLFFSLKIAFKWLVRAFSGYLASDQVLLLWDRVLAYNSLLILPGRFPGTYLRNVQSRNGISLLIKSQNMTPYVVYGFEIYRKRTKNEYKIVKTGIWETLFDTVFTQKPKD